MPTPNNYIILQIVHAKTDIWLNNKTIINNIKCIKVKLHYE